MRRRKSHSQNSFFLFVKKTTREKRCNSNLEKILKNQACKLHFWEKAGNKPLKWRLSKQHSSFRSAITPTGKLGRQHFHAHKTSREKGGSKKIKHTVLCSTYSLSLFITRIFLSRGTTLLALQGVSLHTHARTHHAHRSLDTDCESRLASSVHEVSAASNSCTGADKQEEPHRSEKGKTTEKK